MKSIILVCVLAILVSLCNQAQANCLIFGEDLSVGTHFRNCSKVECLSDGEVRGVGCSPGKCAKGVPTGVEDPDLSKPYPDCCGQTVCSS